MKKLEEPSLSTLKSQTQTVETQRCSKLERLFTEKMSRFINFVPALPNAHSSIIIPENHHGRRMVQSYSRLRRFRARRKTHHRMVIRCISNNESTTVEEISDETTPESENQPKENVEIPQEQTESIPSIVAPNLDENLVSITVTIEKTPESIDDLSSIEKVDHTTTLSLSTTMNTCSTAQHLLLTASSLDETQRSQFRLFITRFGFSTSPTVDSSTTHIIVNENSSLDCPLTGKIIQGIARHLFIVSNGWLNDC
ncbi:unnamed protein product [Rotaria socialis]|uniref:BRCT domain-containing protein n=3 Tax=Rotaria socialis TaxID=392032 RepID=A0A821G3A5_9BILA|nr:unnamed protein product [Rotaria socialis]